MENFNTDTGKKKEKPRKTDDIITLVNSKIIQSK